MLRKLKTLLVVGIAALSLAFIMPNMANAGEGPPGYYVKLHGQTAGTIKYFKNGHPGSPSEWDLVQPYRPRCGSNCDDVIALAEAGIAFGYKADFDLETIVEGDNVPDTLVGQDIVNGGYAFGKDLELSGKALGTGKDKRFWCWTIPGFALADVDLKLVAKVYSIVLTNGVQYNGGVSFSYVNTIGILNFDATALATGTTGCPQFAEVGLEGKFGVGAVGNALSLGPNGSYAITTGEGETMVKVSAYDSDFATSTWFILPGLAHADIDGKIIVTQDLFVMAYVSPDGTTTFNLGVITGGNALAFGDANIEGIRSSGMVSQSAYASDGQSGAAWGNSMASYNGAVGSVNNNRCLDTANGAGLAIVTGYNNVDNSNHVVTITSHQSAFGTTR